MNLLSATALGSISMYKVGYSSCGCNEIYWSIEADIGYGQLILPSGDLESLGCWNPDMAVLLSPSTASQTLWNAEIEAVADHKPDPENAKSWSRFVLRVDRYMCNYLMSGKRTRLAILSSALEVWILLKVVEDFSRGTSEVKPFTTEE